MITTIKNEKDKKCNESFLYYFPFDYPKTEYIFIREWNSEIIDLNTTFSFSIRLGSAPYSSRNSATSVWPVWTAWVRALKFLKQLFIVYDMNSRNKDDNFKKIKLRRTKEHENLYSVKIYKPIIELKIVVPLHLVSVGRWRRSDK